MTYKTRLAEEHPDPVARFFAFARERHGIYLKRQAGVKAPWTDDPILHKFRFTNVFRELDATTVWCKKYVRDPLGDRPETLLAVVLFRWFNRVTTGETLFCSPELDGKSAFEKHLDVYDEKRRPSLAIKVLRAALAKQPPPHVTGSYTINTAGLGNGKTKVEGVLAQYESFLARDWRTRAEQMAVPALRHTLEGTCIWLEDTPGMGGFMAYEVACDLRYTPLLSHAGDVETWANPGPGAQRGIRRVQQGFTEIDDVRRPVNMESALENMRALLSASRERGYWPQQQRESTAAPLRHGTQDPLQVSVTNHEWPAWEMREVEHTLCEFDKYERVRLGQGRPRGVYHG